MTFRCPIGPPPPPQDPWLSRFWEWLTTVWFPKQRALGSGLEYDSSDQVQVDTDTIVAVPTGTGFIHVTAGVTDPAAVSDLGDLSTGLTFQRRRGDKTASDAFTGSEGELSYDTSRKILVVHDGSTAGGEPIAKLAQFSTTEHATGQYIGAKAVYEKSFTVALGAADGDGNIFNTTAHGISGLDLTLLIDTSVSWTLSHPELPTIALFGASGQVPSLTWTWTMAPDSTYLYFTASGMFDVTALTARIRLVYAR